MSTLTPKRILFPTDFSSCAEGAYRHAAYLAARFEAELHVLHVVEDSTTPEREWPSVTGVGHLQISLSDVCEDLRLPMPEPAASSDPADNVSVVEAEVVGRKPADAILDYILDEEVDLVVMGTHGRRGWGRGMLGSVAEAVGRRAGCPVLTVRSLDEPGETQWPPSRVLLALDAISNSEVPPAARWAARFAEAYHAPLDIVHVVNPGVFVGIPMEAYDRPQVRENFHALADTLKQDADESLDVSVVFRAGDPSDRIVALAEEGRTQLLVVGSRGRRGAGRVLLGSVAESLVRSAPCPVLVVRNAAHSPEARVATSATDEKAIAEA